MIVRLPRKRLAAVAITVFLTVPLCVGTTAQTPTRDTQPRAGDGVGIATTTQPALLTESEPNDTPGTADPIATELTAARYVVVSGAINPAANPDVYSFTAPAGSRIWIETDTGGVQGAGANSRGTVIELMASDGVTVIEIDAADGTGNGGDGTTESVNAALIAGRTLTAGGTYFIRVRTLTVLEVVNPYRLFVVMTTAAATVEQEPNDFTFFGLFTNVAVPVSGTFGIRSGAITPANDVDYYSVAATAGSILFFAADADPERDGTGTDVTLALLDSSGVTLHFVDSSFAGSVANPAAEGSNFTIPGDGVYFIKVAHFTDTGTGTYDLMTAVSVPSEDEPNDSPGAAEPISFASTARRAAIFAGAIDPGGDVDYYSFAAVAGSRVWILTDSGGTQNSGATSRDTVIDLLAGDGVSIIESDDNDGTGNGGDGIVESGLASVIGGRTLVTGGTYYIRVRGFTSTIVNPYKLFVVLTNTAATAEVEGNNTVETADVLSTQARPLGLRAGAIGSAGDADYYAIAAVPGTLIYFNVDGDPERDGIGTDLVVEIRSGLDEVRLTVDSSFFAGSLADPSAEGANYINAGLGYTYLRVRHFEGTGTGTYHLMAIAASGIGFRDFTDTSLVATVSTIRDVHIVELQFRINTLRTRFGLAEVTWSHPANIGDPVRAADMTELRTALQQAYSAAGRTAPAFTDPVIVPQGTIVKKVHIDQLRAAVIELEGS
jgi:hypothetical protein